MREKLPRYLEIRRERRVALLAVAIVAVLIMLLTLFMGEPPFPM